MAESRHNRRDFIRRAGLAGVAASLGLEALAGCSSNKESRPPNIILVLSDDQGYGDIHSHGNRMLDTPVLDSLAASGARFERFYVSPVCAPTRAALLTGRYPLRCGVTGVTRSREDMDLDEVTVADVFHEACYATGCFGKWHNGAHYPYHPNGRGFDQFFGFCAGHWNNYFDTTLQRNGEQVETNGYITDVLTDAAMEFMERHSDRPFLVYLPYNAPHSPFQVPDEYFDKYRRLGADEELAAVYGMIDNLDHNLGRLLGRVDELGLTNDTIVIFIGDNGPNTDRYNAGMKGRKASPHEGGVRVPGFISWPGRIEAGTVVEKIAAHIDILPTLTDLAGIENTSGRPLDGVSLAPLLRGKKSGWPERMIFTGFRDYGAVRTDRYRLVVPARGPAELYDMIEDPGQEHEISAGKPEVAERLKNAYDEWYAEASQGADKVPPAPVGYDEWREVTLPGHEAHLDGGLRYMGGTSGWANDWIVGWDAKEGIARWDIEVVERGAYRFLLLYTCPEGQTGTVMRAELGGKSVRARVDKAWDPDPLPSPDRVPRIEVYEKQWAELPLGTLELEPGRMELKVSASGPPPETGLEIKAVKIVKTI